MRAANAAGLGRFCGIIGWMSAWTLAWIDTDVWRKRAHEDPTAMEQVGTTLRDWWAGGEATEELTGFGLLQSEGMTMSFVESPETKLVVWGPGDLAIYPASSPDEVTEFLANKNDENDGSVLIVAVDYDEARRRSGLEVGEAVSALLDGHDKADLGNTMAGVRLLDRVGRDHAVAFAWHRGTLTRTDRLSASDRHDALQILSGDRGRRREQDARLRFAGISVLARKGWGALPIEPMSLTVLLGRNGAGKTTILENIAFALERVRGLDQTDALKVLPSSGRRTADSLPLNARADFSISLQENAPDIFRNVLFLMAYSPVALYGMREMLPHGATIWDALTPIDSPDALDPHHVLKEYDLSSLHAALLDAMLAQVSGTYDVETLRAIFHAYLSSSNVGLDADESIYCSPPDPASISDLARRISESEYVELIDKRAPLGSSARDALFWAFSVLTPGRRQFTGMIAHHPRLAGRAGWEGSPWTEIHDGVMETLRRSLPTTVAFDPDPGTDGIGALVEQLLIDLAKHLLPTGEVDDAQPAHPFSSASVEPVVSILARNLGERATALLPGFAAAEGNIGVRIAPMEEWHRRRVIVEIVGAQQTVAVSAAASGILAWCTACLRFAAAELGASDWFGGDSLGGPTRALLSPHLLTPSIDGPYPFIYLADEPEAHLHPTAIQEIVGLCDRLAAASTGGVVVATHALEFLGQPDLLVTPFLVSEGVAQPLPLGLPALREQAHRLGVTPAMVLLSARAVLCVEGPTDEWALDTFTDGALNRSFVQTLRLYGMNDVADRFPELDLVYSLDIPIYILLDHVRASKLRALVAGENVSDATKEERELHRLAQTLRGRRATVVPMAKVDILRTIPDVAMAAAFEELKHASPWAGWEQVAEAIDQQRAEKRLPFKDAFFSVTGIKIDRVAAILRRLSFTGATSPELMRVTNSLLADISSGRYRTADEGLRVLS
jgi:energy-coupling factor transporter ATP-binding protein EcfA2